ncbi:MAG: hypothetical protein A2V86_08800 [Deltaproteobacteria bacterium RBG_16_49_23]|nr:MAG: hypothetical protein A2V86_08800 [Deltaproteobacteria bacterium RBG_16_49_23]
MDLDCTLSLKQRQIRRMVREFAKAELAPIAREIDEEGHFPWEVVEKMGPLNFFWNAGSKTIQRSRDRLDLLLPGD